MVCPRCNTGLKRKTLAEPGHMLVVDCCPECRGTWFGSEQLRELECIVEPALVEIRNIPPREEQLRSIHCPACKDTFLLKAEHERDRKVIIDHCPSCHGIWLDRGELEAIQKENWLLTLGRLFRFIAS